MRCDFPGSVRRRISERLVPGERVGQVAEVDQVDDLLRGELCQQQPERLALTARTKVPRSVDHGADRHVHDALLRTEPAQLGIADEFAGEVAQPREQGIDVPAHDMAGERLDRRALHIVAPADGEHEALARLTVAGEQFDVGGRVVRVRVHGV